MVLQRIMSAVSFFGCHHAFRVGALNLSTARSNGFIGACIGLYATLQQ